MPSRFRVVRSFGDAIAQAEGPQRSYPRASMPAPVSEPVSLVGRAGGKGAVSIARDVSPVNPVMPGCKAGLLGDECSEASTTEITTPSPAATPGEDASFSCATAHAAQQGIGLSSTGAAAGPGGVAAQAPPHGGAPNGPQRTAEHWKPRVPVLATQEGAAAMPAAYRGEGSGHRVLTDVDDGFGTESSGGGGKRKRKAKEEGEEARFARQTAVNDTEVAAVRAAGGASALKDCDLSRHIQQRLRACGPVAESLVVKVVAERQSSAGGYAHRAKAIMLFDTGSGVGDVAVLAVYANEYGAEAEAPNARRVYVECIDGLPLRTDESGKQRDNMIRAVLFGYMEHLRERGFVFVHFRAPSPNDQECQIFSRCPKPLRVTHSMRTSEWLAHLLGEALRQQVVDSFHAGAHGAILNFPPTLLAPAHLTTECIFASSEGVLTQRLAPQHAILLRERLFVARLQSPSAGGSAAPPSVRQPKLAPPAGGAPFGSSRKDLCAFLVAHRLSFCSEPAARVATAAILARLLLQQGVRLSGVRPIRPPAPRPHAAAGQRAQHVSSQQARSPAAPPQAPAGGVAGMSPSPSQPLRLAAGFMAGSTPSPSGRAGSQMEPLGGWSGGLGSGGKGLGLAGLLGGEWSPAHGLAGGTPHKDDLGGLGVMQALGGSALGGATPQRDDASSHPPTLAPSPTLSAASERSHCAMRLQEHDLDEHPPGGVLALAGAGACEASMFSLGA